MQIQSQVVGCCGDILDVLLIPSSRGQDTSEDVGKGQSGEENGVQLAVISNSANVQIFDEQFHSKTLYGHTDIVLAVDVSYDG